MDSSEDADVGSTYLIAEAGVNHNGSLDQARRLVSIAAKAGADAVKFQTFRADALTVDTAEKAAYQKNTTDDGSQREMLRSLELSPPFHESLLQHCREEGIQFLSSPFDPESVDLLVDTFDVPRIKIPSGEITNGPLLLHIAQTGRPVILSTGMSTLGEIERALGVLAFGYLDTDEAPEPRRFRSAYASDQGQEQLRDHVVLLHCTSEYPAPFDDVNLRALDTLRSAFGLPVGLSDHTRGTAVPVAAVARGAVAVEKHFTLDRTLPGPDHRASLEPDELARMVKDVRRTERALGSSQKRPTPSETKNRPVARKSLVAAEPIAQGERFTDDNLTAKRPGTGRSPMQHWDLVGRTATRDYDADDLVAA